MDGLQYVGTISKKRVKDDKENNTQKFYFDFKIGEYNNGKEIFEAVKVSKDTYYLHKEGDEVQISVMVSSFNGKNFISEII